MHHIELITSSLKHRIHKIEQEHRIVATIGKNGNVDLNVDLGKSGRKAALYELIGACLT